MYNDFQKNNPEHQYDVYEYLVPFHFLIPHTFKCCTVFQKWAVRWGSQCFPGNRRGKVARVNNL